MCLYMERWLRTRTYGPEYRFYGYTVAQKKRKGFIPLYYRLRMGNIDLDLPYQLGEEYTAIPQNEGFKYYGFHGYNTMPLTNHPPYPNGVILLCEFRHPISVGYQCGIPAFRAKYRTILKVVKCCGPVRRFEETQLIWITPRR